MPVHLTLAQTQLALYVLFGALAGFGYHRFIGCRTGACVIWTNKYFSTLYGAALGYLLGSGR